MSLRRLRFIMVVSLLIVVFSPATASAYLDPGTGSLVIQIVIASLATGLFVLKTKWAQIKAMFNGRAADVDADSSASGSKQDSQDN